MEEFRADNRAKPTRGSRSALSGRMVDFAERWFPDSYVFVLAAVAVVAIGSMLHGCPPMEVSRAFGDGFWNLLPFTMQMILVAVGGYVVSTSKPAAVALGRLARAPGTPRGAVVFVGVVSILLSLLNWGLSLIFSGLLVKEIARRPDLRLDFRAAGAAAYLGLGCGFTLGLTSSAAQLQANPASIPANLVAVTGVIPFSETILTWQNGLVTLVVLFLSAAVCFWTAPPAGAERTAADLGVALDPEPLPRNAPAREAGFLEDSPILTLAVVALALGWLAQTFATKPALVALSGLNTYNFAVLVIGMLLHWRPSSFVGAFAGAMPAVSGVALQFPFYAGIAQMLTGARNGAGASLSDALADAFVGASASPTVFSFLVGVYSAILGFFIPSAGGKWVIEAPYVMKAANDVGAHLGWTVMVYNIAETLPNLINPFWMLPLIGILGLKAKDLIGYTSIQFLVHAPIVLLLAAALMATFAYHPPTPP